MLKRLTSIALLFLATPALADRPAAAETVMAAVDQPNLLQIRIEQELANAPSGTRFGLMVVDDQGRSIVEVNPDMRFVPASNTKMVTTAAALALLPDIDKPDVAGGTQVFLLREKRSKVPDVMLYGRGDARMSSAPDCTQNCLAALADAVAAKTKVVGDVLGDDSFFPDQRWSPGMSWNNFGSNDATAASALSLDANEMTVKVSPGQMGKPPEIIAPPYARIRNEAVTVSAGAPTNLVIEHTPNSREFRLHGQIAIGNSGWSERIGIDDPAHYTAFVFADMLRARGVKVTGAIRVKHQPVMVTRPDQDATAATLDAGHDWLGGPLAALTPPPLAEMPALVNKPSQNHHAEQLLRRIGRLKGSGSLADGLAAEQAFLQQAGVPRQGYDLFDGSGMSTYNRFSPRAMMALLTYARHQPWGPAWLASFPVSGVDGTLKRRFKGTPLEGQVNAKTGTLNGTNALSGTLTTAKGRTFTFVFFANDVPDGTSAIPTMEKVLQLIHAAN
ncbi:MAG: D-alanyl-D-alanine carboxypeptidase/D-alanyl-D-alanine-endopeptidase [Novosphingobium sp.]|uniref:D-alanyl-D-alanine carboxypeptidase/D-alanyl-D-alanine endopeptidase n=1 Tax=Novosphingobium sp. TaxID=1874826 RepID=UPI0032BE2271